MSTKWLKNILTAFLILVMAGAVFVCLTIGTMTVSHVSHGSSTTEDSANSHILHSKELTQATIVINSLLALASFILILAFTPVLFSLHKLEFFIQNKLLSYLRFRKRHLFSKTQFMIHLYLSLFVRSPEYMRST